MRFQCSVEVQRSTRCLRSQTLGRNQAGGGADTKSGLLPLAHAAMERFLRLRRGCHRLPKDIGSQTGVPRRQRLCQLCSADYGDEMRLVKDLSALAW